MNKDVSSTQTRDTGLALAFLCLLLGQFFPTPYLIYGAMAILLLTMIHPGTMTYPAVLWFGLSHLMGAVVSKVILGALFFLLVVPVAAIRRVMGKDSLHLRLWKRKKGSTFTVRNHKFSKDDVLRQF